MAIGQTLLRTHFGAQVSLRTDAETDPALIQSIKIGWGVCSVLQTGGTTPNALTGTSDQAPPLQRWLWWSMAALIPGPGPGHAYSGFRTWSAVTAPNPVDIEAMVAAPTAAVNIKMSVAVASALPTDVVATLNHWSSCLVR